VLALRPTGRPARDDDDNFFVLDERASVAAAFVRCQLNAVPRRCCCRPLQRRAPPDAAKRFQLWLIATLSHACRFNQLIVRRLDDCLTREASIVITEIRVTYRLDFDFGRALPFSRKIGAP